MRCPLCDGERQEPSWFGGLLFEGDRYDYRRCLRCGSSHCEPMPSNEVLARMYGPAYTELDTPEAGYVEPKQPERVLDWLGRRSAGTFVDFGCGSGELVAAAAHAGWNAIGVEFDEKVARDTEAATGCRVLHGFSGLAEAATGTIDVMHLGDVIEHLTTPRATVQSLVSLLAREGALLAQGPLEAGPCLFTEVLRLARWGRPRPLGEGPPFHVLQATVAGQRFFFQRVGLEALAFSVSEVSWPAPERLQAHVLARPKALSLYLIRRASQAVSRLAPHRWGNRYFYAGRRDSG